MTYHLALASPDPRSIALGFAMFSCLPAAVLTIAGTLVHATPQPDRSGIYGASGIRLFTALICSIVAGLVAGTILVLPTGMDLSVLTGALIFSLSAGAITWFSRETIPTALISVGTMLVATGALVSMCAVCFPQNFRDSSLTSLSSYFFTALVAFLFPGLVTTIIAACMAVQSAAPAHLTSREEGSAMKRPGFSSYLS
ncbi:hypothetical protein [uncultured Corynebacterium sp.]|uniref:hypothetical protein n=1 Tax=uncultured Corynebacterium sp. TaxID=159447 RepID=UPI002804E4EC|nr:hypothetical protein [uncultured Corynebacterium sp.]